MTMDAASDQAQSNATLKKAALVYDFDGTLASGNLPEHSLFPALGVKDVGEFWTETKKLAAARDADEILTYMGKILDVAAAARVPITKAMLKAHGAQVPFFSGVVDWFDHINRYGKSIGFEIEHYVISSGLLEIIEGCAIYPRFERVFASAYAYDEAGHAIWPASAINYTTKTQFLFRINKGIPNTHDNTAINRWQPPQERPVPFEHMVFIGDGDTDIPSMKMVRHQGGQAVAVFDPKKWAERALQGKLRDLIAEDRVDYVAPADFTRDQLLDVTIQGILGRMASRRVQVPR